MTTLIICNGEMNDIMKTTKSLEESGLLIKQVSEIVKHETKEQKGGFIEILLGTLGTSLLGNLLTGKGAITTNQGRKVNIPGRGTIIPGEGLELARIFGVTSSFRKFGNTNMLSK